LRGRDNWVGVSSPEPRIHNKERQRDARGGNADPGRLMLSQEGSMHFPALG